MANDFSELVPWLERIANTLTPAQKRTLTRNIANRGKRSMGARITAQRDPSGASFVKRRRNRIRPDRRGALFQRTARQIKTSYSPVKAEIGYNAWYSRIMKVHQYGLADRATAKAPMVNFAVRETVGWSKEDEAMIIEEMQNLFNKL